MRFSWNQRMKFVFKQAWKGQCYLLTSILITMFMLMSFFISFSYTDFYEEFELILNSTAQLTYRTDLLRATVGEKKYHHLLQMSTPLNFSDAKNMTKKHIIIVTAWRSGSTYFHNLLSSHSGFMDHYETLHPIGIKRIMDLKHPDADYALNLIREILLCRYNDERFLNYTLSRNFVLGNKWLQLLERRQQQDISFRKDILSAFCSLFPWSAMKLVRTGIGLLKDLLEDESLNVHLIFLVRDPRPVMVSREQQIFCISSECSSPFVLCKNMLQDLKAFEELYEQFPGKLHIVRYEDLFQEPTTVLKRLLERTGIRPTFETEDIVNNNMLVRETNTINQLERWVTNIKLQTLVNVQNSCGLAMEKFGYKILGNQTAPSKISKNDILLPFNLTSLRNFNFPGI